MMRPTTLPAIETPKVDHGTRPAAALAAASRGESAPIGATVVPGGVNFCTFSRTATEMELLLFNKEDDLRPARTIALDPVRNRT